MTSGLKTCSTLQERLRHEEEVEVNNGVWWQASLSVVPADEGATRSKGIKRGADKARSASLVSPAASASDIFCCLIQ